MPFLLVRQHATGRGDGQSLDFAAQDVPAVMPSKRATVRLC